MRYPSRALLSLFNDTREVSLFFWFVMLRIFFLASTLLPKSKGMSKAPEMWYGTQSRFQAVAVLWELLTLSRSSLLCNPNPVPQAALAAITEKTGHSGPHSKKTSFHSHCSRCRPKCSRPHGCHAAFTLSHAAGLRSQKVAPYVEPEKSNVSHIAVFAWIIVGYKCLDGTFIPLIPNSQFIGKISEG